MSNSEENYSIEEGLLKQIEPHLIQYGLNHGYNLSNPQGEDPNRILVKSNKLTRQIEVIPHGHTLEVLAAAWYDEGNIRYHKVESAGLLTDHLDIARLVEALDRANVLASSWNSEDLRPYQKQKFER